MNATRKEIIEIIEPYMDKTLSEGCLYTRLEEDRIVGIYTYMSEEGSISEKGNILGIMNWEYEILGHYDITAVLKYVEDRKELVEFSPDLSTIGIETIVNRRFFYREIPHKPIHLYTEQQEKDLLKILKELGTK